uniref:Uncharacterized protein n=1 Tax=Sphaeramia orbicularis TaxID=375764 RepID=A0A673APJ6_9TELE
MDPEVNCEPPEDVDNTDTNVDFSQVKTVATGWMLDFLFVSLCRSFKENNLDEFKDTISAIEGVSVTFVVCNMFFCLDVRFDDDNKVMPLMSAAKLWTTLKDTVADEALFKNITVLLLVQVILQTIFFGVFKMVVLFNDCLLQQNLKTKLSTVLSKSDSYHPFIMSFSFSRLLETVQALHVTEKHTILPYFLRTKRKLLSTRSPEVWMPESCKKVKVCLTKIPKSGKFCFKWTAQLDKYLKDGVRRHGLGKWSRILQDYDFEGRTGVMLKDRWRILMKAHKVS